MAYIDKELFKQDVKMRYCNNCARPNEIKCRACHIDDMLGEIEDAPTAGVVEVKRGKWIEHEVMFYDGDFNSEYPRKGYKCSLCGRVEWNKEPYCHCGAKNGR